MLLRALIPANPYGYYITLLGWICCAAFAYLAIHAWELRRNGWVWVLGVTAAIYNPILRVHATREIWSIVNLITIALAIASIFVLKSEEGDTRYLGESN